MFTLIDLPYGQNALEPVISAQTLSFHHGKHLQAYVDNLNKLLPGSGLEDKSLEEIVVEVSLDLADRHARPDRASGALFNNAGQVLNHNLYFTQFKSHDQAVDDGKASAPSSSSLPAQSSSSLPAQSSSSLPAPTGNLAKQIEKQWGTIDAFKAEFEAKGVGLFGSGWVWLSADEDGKLFITQEGPAGNPVTRIPGSPTVMPGQTGHLRPLLTFDVWEHAYYLDYQNRRAAHLNALWNILDWKVIEERYKI